MIDEKRIEKIEKNVDLIRIDLYNLGLQILRIDKGNKRVLKINDMDITELATKISKIIKVQEGIIDVPDSYITEKIIEVIKIWLDERDIIL